jgi:eukaryotic-like serine/threonine-protein kinase
MVISCPYCRHQMNLKDPKPGRYQPKCSKCSRRFALTIPAEPSGQPEIRALPDSSEATLTPAGSDATLAGPEPNATMAACEPDATLAGDTPSRAPVAAESDATLAHEAAKPTAAAVRSDATLAAADPDGTCAMPESPTGRTAGAAPRTRAVAPTATRGTVVDATEAGPPARQTVADGARSAGKSAGLVLGATLGGYKLLKELGRGAMGAVYLARQLSLNRDVALKVIQAKWADNPTFLARFTREAYAAAQLTHHNVVQIYDLGVSADVNFFSMEFVRGESLAELLEKRGSLDVAAAVGYTLQAARGLEFAHRQGMIHRDVKPANLMLSDEGIVKVADLGLVKTLQSSEGDGDEGPADGSADDLADMASDITVANMAMGTPAYMSPEQIQNAAGVDHRADIYSLGCTLYALLTGRPPFQGATAMEVMTKHKLEPVVRPDALVTNLPPGLSEIVLKMVAKDPDQRYQTLGEVGRDLETFLAEQRSGPPKLGDEHLQVLRQALAEFQAAPTARLQSRLPWPFFGLCLLLIVGGLLFSWAWSFGVAVMAATGAAGYLVINGLRQGSPLWDKVRESAWNSNLGDWVTRVLGVALAVLCAWLLGWLWAGVAGVAVGLVLAFGFDLLSRRVARERQPALDRVSDMLRSLRLAGVEEAKLRDFAAQGGGEAWEEFYEALFGYEAKLAARQRQAEWSTGRPGRKFAAWRDPLVARLDARLRRIRAAREQRHLERVEQQRLRAQGLDDSQSRTQAQRLAAAMVGQAAAARVEVSQAASAAVDPKLAAAQKRERIKRMLAEARSEAPPRRFQLGERIAHGPLGLVLGGRMRFVLGCLLLAGCVLWARQNDLLGAATQQIRGVSSSVESRDLSGLTGSLRSGAEFTAQPLQIPLVGRWFDSIAPGVAGLTLIFLALFRGWKMSVFALPSAALMVCGPAWGLPGIATLGGATTTAIVLGLGVAALGFLFGRSGDEDDE